MPRRDGTGPMGRGAMTGRGSGYCTGIGSGRYGAGIRRGFGRGLGLGLGLGSGYGCRRGYGGFYPAEMTETEEIELLKEEKEILEKRLEIIKKQLENSPETDK